MALKILKAWWHDQNSVLAVFPQDLHRIPEVEFYLGGKLVRDFEISHAPKKIFSEYSSYFIKDGKLTFTLSETGGILLSENEKYYVGGNFNSWEKCVGQKKWELKKIENSPAKYALEIPYFEKYLDSEISLADFAKSSEIIFKFIDSNGCWIEPSASSPNVFTDDKGNRNLKIFRGRSGDHMLLAKFESYCDLSNPLEMRICEAHVSAMVDAGKVLSQLYSGSELGAHLRDGKTRFSIFAPRASSAKIIWGFDKNNLNNFIDAFQQDGAVWIAEANSNISGAFYYWMIDGKNFDTSSNFNSRAKIIDPYALAMYSSNGPSVVKYISDIPRPKYFKPPAWHDLIIVEAHVRDLIARADESLLPDERDSFDGLAKWLKSPDCYLRKCGANCVELQPIHEFTAENRNDYEWGYMPVSWFAPSSSYAKTPEEISQCSDFSKLVDAFHDAGLAVILDVVYNHVGEPNYLSLIDKEYYFELSPNDNFMNYSGCGNDFKASSPMAKRMILDSLKLYLSHYRVDGFRFDLAELLGVGVLKEIETELKKINPSVILIAEPWSFRGRINAALSNTGWASWNDGFREFMLNYVKGQGNFDGLKYFISGSRGAEYKWPSQTVNYMESHDDMCLLDRISQTPHTPSVEDLRRHRLALALVLLSVGIPMLAEGCDLTRTKGGLNNTYKNGEANALDYIRALKFSGNGEWIRKFIAFRNSPLARALRLSENPSSNFFKFFKTQGSAGGVMFNADSSLEGAPKILALFNPEGDYKRINMDLDLLAEFRQIADIDRFNASGLDECWTNVISGDDSVYGKVSSVFMPPLSLCLYIAT